MPQKGSAGRIPSGSVVSLTFCRALRDISAWIGTVEKLGVDLLDEKTKRRQNTDIDCESCHGVSTTTERRTRVTDAWE
jgi:hypothetical protein